MYNDIRDVMQAALDDFSQRNPHGFCINQYSPFGDNTPDHKGCAVGRFMPRPMAKWFDAGEPVINEHDDKPQMLYAIVYVANNPTKMAALRTIFADTISLDELQSLQNMHDSSVENRDFCSQLQRWLAQHPYVVQFPIVKVSEHVIEVPHG